MKKRNPKKMTLLRQGFGRIGRLDKLVLPFPAPALKSFNSTSNPAMSQTEMILAAPAPVTFLSTIYKAGELGISICIQKAF